MKLIDKLQSFENKCPRKTFILDDYDFVSGYTCFKKLWLDRNKPEEKENNFNSSVIFNSHEVKEAAKGLLDKKSATVEKDWDKKTMVLKTKEYLEDEEVKVIFNATFDFYGLVSTVDMLKKEPDGSLSFYTVKSTTKYKDEYGIECAYKYFVATNCNVKVKSNWFLYINNSYVRKGNLDIKSLFLAEDLTGPSTFNYYVIEGELLKMIEYLEVSDEQESNISMACEEPYECPFRKYCLSKLEKDNVFTLSGMFKKDKYALYDEGITSFKELYDAFGKNKIDLSKRCLSQIETALKIKDEVLDKGAIRSFLNTISYPIYHLDFETVQFAVPKWDGSKPWEQIPFQYSLHIEHEDGTIKHKEFLAKAGKDPRRELAERLCEDIPMGSFSVAYNMTFEKTRLKELAELFPDLKDHLMNIYNNMHDLMVPFKELDIYLDEMKGSYSIKHVLPAMCPGDPELDYHALSEVHNGTEAQSAFLSLKDKAPKKAETTRTNLLKYCELDTLAMVKVLDALRKKVGIK